MPDLRPSFSPVTLADIRWNQRKRLTISKTRLEYLCDKYGLGRIECALLMQAQTVDQWGRLPE